MSSPVLAFKWHRLTEQDRVNALVPGTNGADSANLLVCGRCSYQGVQWTSGSPNVSGEADKASLMVAPVRTERAN